MLNQFRKAASQFLMAAPQMGHFDSCHRTLHAFVAVLAARPVQALLLVVVGKDTKNGWNAEVQIDVLDALGHSLANKSEMFGLSPDHVSYGNRGVEFIVMDHVLAAEYQFKASRYPGSHYIFGQCTIPYPT